MCYGDDSVPSGEGIRFLGDLVHTFLLVIFNSDCIAARPLPCNVEYQDDDDDDVSMKVNGYYGKS